MIPYLSLLAKVVSYILLAPFGTAVLKWSPAAAVVICTTAFATDGLLTSLVAAAPPRGRVGARVLAFLVPLGSLLVGRGLAAFLGLG